MTSGSFFHTLSSRLDEILENILWHPIEHKDVDVPALEQRHQLRPKRSLAVQHERYATGFMKRTRRPRQRSQDKQLAAGCSCAHDASTANEALLQGTPQGSVRTYDHPILGFRPPGHQNSERTDTRKDTMDSSPSESTRTPTMWSCPISQTASSPGIFTRQRSWPSGLNTSQPRGPCSGVVKSRTQTRPRVSDMIDENTG